MAKISINQERFRFIARRITHHAGVEVAPYLTNAATISFEQFKSASQVTLTSNGRSHRILLVVPSIHISPIFVIVSTDGYEGILKEFSVNGSIVTHTGEWRKSGNELDAFNVYSGVHWTEKDMIKTAVARGELRTIATTLNPTNS